MLSQRRIEIFKAIVDEFILTAEPVGSKTLLEKYNLKFSSATIRNDMQGLEELGYLEKTHTSSGRIPSTLGYKFYCEHLLQDKQYLNTEFALQEVFSNKLLNVDDAIRKSCEILSQMTNLTSGALGPDANSQHLKHIKLFPIDARSAVAIFITDKGHTENRTFSFSDDVTVDDIQNCCSILNDRLQGTLISDVLDKMDAIRPILAKSVQRHEILFQAFVNAFIKLACENVYFSGANNLMYQPEFADIEKLKSLMKMLDDNELWKNIGKQDQIAIKTSGNSEFVWLDDVAVVTSNFTLDNDECGKLMVVGPSRMDYDKIASMLEYVSGMIEKSYGKV